MVINNLLKVETKLSSSDSRSILTFRGVVNPCLCMTLILSEPNNSKVPFAGLALIMIGNQSLLTFAQTQKIPTNKCEVVGNYHLISSSSLKTLSVILKEYSYKPSVV